MEKNCTICEPTLKRKSGGGTAKTALALPKKIAIKRKNRTLNFIERDYIRKILKKMLDWMYSRALE